MSRSNPSKAAAYTASLLALPVPAAHAGDFTAKTVMEKMEAEHRYPYIAGVVEGLAYARYMRDGKKTEGMECIYGWFYDKPGTLNVIYAAFGQYPQFTPGAIIGALTKKACGE